MRKTISLVAFAAALQAAPAQAGEFSVGLGPFFLSDSGADFHLAYRATQSHWRFGYRYLQYTETDEDPFFGTDLTESKTTMHGPTLAYLFTPESRGSWYVSGAVMKAKRVERALLVNEEARDSATGAFFGGGYLGFIGQSGYWQVGLTLSPGTKLETRTSASSTEESGLADFTAHIGIRF